MDSTTRTGSSVARFPERSPSPPVPTGRDPWLLLALSLWPLLWVVFAAVAPHDGRGVYAIFARASERWWAGEPLYPPAAPMDDVFRYTPTFAVSFTPFSALPDLLGEPLFNLIGLTLLFFSLRLAVRRLLPDALTPRQEGVFLLLTLAGTVRGFWAAQTNVLLLALILFGAMAALDRRWWTATALLTATVFVKLWPIALIALLATYWPKPLLARLPVLTAAFAAVPFLTRPWREALAEHVAFYEVLVRTAPLRWRGYRDGWTILEQVTTPSPAIYHALQVAGAVALLGWLSWQRRRLGRVELLWLTLQSWAAWQLLLGPATERLTYGLIAPFTAAAVVDAFARRRWRALAIGAFLMTAILGAGEAERALLPIFPWAPAIQPAGVVVFVIWLALRYGVDLELGPHSGPAPEMSRKGAMTR